MTGTPLRNKLHYTFLSRKGGGPAPSPFYKLEQMDVDTLNEFGQWLEAEGLQAIATRVSTGDECSILISDGYSYDMEGNPTFAHGEENKKKEWKAGVF